MRKFILAIILLLTIPLMGAYRKSADFLASAVAVNATITKVNGTDFTSVEVNLSYPPDLPTIGALTVTFTRAAGSASTVDFEFQVSYDGGTSWTTAYYVRIQVATNETAVSNVVKVTKPVYLYGISHMRLYRIVNNDGANNLTACNAKISL